MVLHANWSADALHLWGTGDINTVPVVLAAPEELRAVLGEWSSDALLASIAAESTLRLWLPAGGADGSAGALCPVLVPTLRLPPAQAVDLLTSLPEPLPAGCADSIRYWRRLARFVVQHLSERQFYPDIHGRSELQSLPSQPSITAAWRLLVHGREEVIWLEQLAAAMPPACRAMAEEAGQASSAPDAQQLVESFLHATADALVRRAVGEDPFFQAIHARAADPASPAETRWLSALLGPDPVVHAGGEQATVLLEQARTWVARLEEGRSPAVLRLCFRLEEPSQTQEKWHVVLQLQSLEADSQFIDAASLWEQASPASPRGILGRQIADRRQQLLTQLARVAAVFPPAERVLAMAAPGELALEPAEAHLFIRQWGPQLAEKGFGVFLPDWVQRRDRELGLQLIVHPLQAENGESLAPVREGRGSGGAGPFSIDGGQMGLESLLEFDWQVAVGDLRLTPEEFRSLIQQDQPLVRYGGRWLQMDLEAARRALQFLDRKPRGRLTLAEAIRTALATSQSDTGLPVLGISGTDWIQELLEQSPATRVQATPQPSGFCGTLRAYQLRGLGWLSFLDRLAIGACLADDMGLGKTIQLIALLLHEREGWGEGSGFRVLNPTLLFAPTSVVGNWLREVQRFGPSLRVMVHHGPERLRDEAFARAAREHDLIITSYALAYRDLEDLRRVHWHRLALDEAQKIKNPSAASTLAIRSLSATHRVALTGTPIENHLSELWSIMEILNPGLLGSAAEFRERFAVPIERLADQDRAQLLRRMIQPFVLRRSKADPQVAGDLPEKMEMRVYCNLTPEQAGMYQRITEEMLGQIDAAAGIRRRGLILAALTRLKQVCDHPVLLAGKRAGGGGSPAVDSGLRTADRRLPTDLSARSGKCERLVEMLEEVLEEGDAALVFTQYREMGHLLEKLLAERLRTTILFLHGGTTLKQRDALVARFQKPDSDARVFILSLRAGGLGLNLTAANHVFHFDRWWNPAVEAQATDRAHRIGQTRKVQVHKYVCIGTMEERIDRMLSDKLALADRIVGTGDEWLTNLSTEELRQTLALSADAVADF